MARKLEIVTNGRSIFVALKHVVYLKADGSYTHIHVRLPDKSIIRYNQSHNLGYYTALLDYSFIRVRSNYLVNTRYITGLNNNRTVYLNTPDNHKIEVPKKRWGYLRAQIDNHLVIPFAKSAHLSDQKGDW